jgi:release factor glutamine methyltransferase
VLGLDLDDPAGFKCLEDKGPLYDLILANPPYIDEEDEDLDRGVRLFEPRSALFAAGQGLEKIFNWSQKSADLLSSKGVYLCEIGWKQGNLVRRWFEEHLSQNFAFSLHRDLSGNDRYFSLTRKREAHG